MQILVASDGSEAAERAVEFAAKLSRDLRGNLKIIHVISVQNLPMDQFKEYGLWEHVTLGEVLNTFAEEKLTAARKKAQALGITEVETESPYGDAAEIIIEAARRDQVDMIVLGKRGRGRLSGLVLGSVSQKVVSVAPCPVVVVP
jgi:nucleotide-binding universal stress UspA family protein